MKKSILLIFTIAMFAFSVSCGNKTEKDNGDSEAQQAKSPQQEQPLAHQKEEHEQESYEAVQLNNGNLWEANIETTEGIEAMKNLVGSFSTNENMDAYKNLKQNLDKEYSTIITKCTMTGEADEQLHHFLIPIRDLFDGLTAPDLDTRKASLDKIDVRLKEYPKYFN